MNLIFLPAAFLGAFLATSRSLGWGFVAVFAVGYFNGVIRANYLSVYTTFMFDAAVLGLYLGFIFGKSRWGPGLGSGPARGFVLFLIAWPTLLSSVPVNHFLIQLVALRATIWYLPVLLIATRLTASDLAVITRGLVVLNLAALAGGIYVYRNGVEALYPYNAVTEIIYNSHDIAGNEYHRIPATFLNAHSYGGTMLFTLPFFLDRLVGLGVRRSDRILAILGIVAAGGGLLMCGARMPLVLLSLSLAVAWILNRFSLRLGLIGAVLIGVGLWVASNNERLQRASTLEDSSYVSHRIAGSTNANFLALALKYPGGAGMGSSVGTSVPFFLADKAPKQIGLENEYSRIMVDQGWIGLVGWTAFVGWLYLRPPPARPPVPWRLGVVFMYSLSLTSWMTAFIGTGTLSSIPQSVLLLAQMGILVGVRERGIVPGVVGPQMMIPRTTRR